MPDPLAPAVTVNHSLELLAAVQAQPALALTATSPDPPPAGNVIPVESSVALHVPAAPACVNVALVPPALIVALRGAELVLAAALKLTVPLPVPFVPAVMASQAVALLVAVQLHPAVVFTAICPLPPAAVRLIAAGVIA